MKNIEISVQLECSCDEDIIVSQPVTQFARSLADLSFKCVKCGTKYFIHIQEIKNDNRKITEV